MTESKHPLKAWRDGHGLTQVACARRFGISQAHWCDLERGVIYASPRLAKRLHDATGIALDRLLNFGDNETVAVKRR